MWQILTICIGAGLLALDAFKGDKKSGQKLKIILANPRGFCAGVDRAISIVELALEIHGAPIYVRHEVVHNRFVVNGLRERGAIFVEELSEVPDGAIVIFLRPWCVTSRSSRSKRSSVKSI